MRVFSFDPAEYRQQYAERGWVHIRGGVDPEFLEHLQDFTRRRFEEKKVEGRGIGGTKEQAVFEFPDAVDFPDELFDVVAEVAGLNRPGMTLSERHIKAYDPDAPANPRPHKDRLSSQVSVGLSIDIPAGSKLVLYPNDDVSPNPFNVSGALLGSLSDEEQPERTLADAEEIVIEDEPGDVMMFPGSAVWHLRRNAANATNLYLKFNDFGSDPLGEDPRTEELREATRRALDEGGVEELVAVPSRRLDTLTRQRTRVEGIQVVQADVWGSDPVRLSEDEARLVESLNGGRPVSGLGSLDAVRRLAERGVIDLVAR